MNPRPPNWPPPPGGWPPPPPHGMPPGPPPPGMPPPGPPPPGMPPPGRPPRRKPGEGMDEEKRKGRCLIREDAANEAPKQEEIAEKPAPQPTRKLADKPAREPRGAKSSDYRLLNGIRVSRRFFWGMASALSLIVIAALSIPLAMMLKAPAPSDIVEEEMDRTVDTDSQNAGAQAQTIRTAPLRDSYQELKSAAVRKIDEPASRMEEVLIANANQTNMQNVRTLSFEGSTNSNSRTYETNIFAKAPNQIRQVLALEDLKLTSIFDGANGQIKVQDFKSGRESERELTFVQNLTLMMAALPNWPLWQANQDASQLVDGGQTTVKGQIYTVIENNSMAPITVQHLFDEDNYERLRRAKYTTDDGEHSIEVRFNQYQRSGEYYVPTEIEIEERGTIHILSKVTVAEWSFNKGLLPSLFVVDDN